jgi:diguanylate cyclase (GGDEF)-like protein/PAS domain S-box-containing protein
MLVRNISVEQGLSQSQVNCLYQDPTGFIWIGTKQGLNRYDGYGFQIYTVDPGNPDSLPDENIQSVFKDEEGTLWVATFSGGIAFQRKNEESFHTIPALEVIGEDGGKGVAVTFTALNDSDGNIWLATDVGVIVLDRFGIQRHHYRKKTGELPDDVIRTLFKDHRGNIWIGTENGCTYFSRKDKKFVPVSFTLNEPRIGENNAVKAIQEDSVGRLWLGTRDGVFVYLPVDRPGKGITGKTVKHLTVLPVGKQTADSENLWALEFDGVNYMWGATHEQGLMRWNIDTFESTNFSADISFSRGLTTNAMRTLLFDRTGLLWIGTRGRGAYIWNSDSMAFQAWQEKPGDPESLSDNEVWSMAQTDPDSVWVGTFAGLNHIDFKTGKVACYFEKHSDGGVLTSGFIETVAAEPETGNVIIFSAKAMDCFHPDSGKVESFSWPDLASRLGVDPRIGFGMNRSMAKDVVLLSLEDMIVKWNYRNGDVQKLRLAPDHHFSDDGLKWISCAVSEDDGFLMLGSNFGIFRIDSSLEHVEHFLKLRDWSNSQPDHTVYCMNLAQNGDLWVGTSNSGIFSYRYKEGTLEEQRHYTVENGLLSDMIFGLLEDSGGHLWASSMAGLSRIELKNGWIKNFDYLDGLSGNEFNGGAFLKGEDGRLMFGGVTGLVSFFPDQLTRNSFHSPVVFTGLKSTESHFFSLKNDDEVTLTHRDQIIKISFSVLDYTMPNKNTYRSILQGYQKDWVYLGDEHSQTFTNLDAGSYTYLLQGINSNGAWNETPLRLKINILPAPWRSIWAYLVYLAIIASIIGMFWRLQAQKIHERRVNTQALREREQRLTLALWGSGDTMWDWEKKSNSFVYTKITGKETSTWTQTYKEYLKTMNPLDSDTVKQQWMEHLSGTLDSFAVEFRMQNDQGEWIWLSQRGMIVQNDAEGEVERIAGTMKDITSSKQAENNLRLLASAFESTLEAMVITDQSWKVTRVNQAFSQITGYCAEDIIGKSFHLLNSSDHDSDFFAQINAEIDKNGAWQGEIWMKNMFGRVFPTWRTTNVIRDVHGEKLYMATVFLDISQHKKQENELRILANYDHLTGLPNRSLFHDRLNQAMANCKRNKLEMAMFFLDLDRFKWINDSYGHKYGDKVLIEVSRRLKGLVREQDTVARLGGDEFVIILEDIKGSRNAAKLADNLVKNLVTPLCIDDHEFVISTSLGIAMYPEDGTNSQALVTNSDAAMYFAKQEGRNNYQFYARSMNTKVQAKLELETSMRKAIASEEYLLYFQPRVSLKTMRPVGAEVLIRWNSPDNGLISPMEFIPLAEATGLIIPLGEWVIKTAFKLIMSFQKKGLPELTYSINLSSRQFKDKQLLPMIEKHLNAFQVNPHWIEMEITEGAIMDKTDFTLEVLRKINELGIKISVDDFGTGYSSLSYLQRFPINALKIDQSFISDQLLDAGTESAIVRAIVSLGHSLDLVLVAEGLETREQVDFLKNLNCQEGQGYYFSKPMNEKDFCEYLRRFEPY